MPSGYLPYGLFLTQCFFDNLVALLRAPPTWFGHLSLPAGSPAYLWPFHSHLSSVPNLVGRYIHAIELSRELTENFVHHRPNSAQRMIFAHPCLWRQVTEHMTLLLIFSTHDFLYHRHLSTRSSFSAA